MSTTFSGSFILHEAPLVNGPAYAEDYSIFCLGCSEEMKKGMSPVNCPHQCAWPNMCGKEECWQEGSLHTQGECSFFKAFGVQMTTENMKNRWVIWRSRFPFRYFAALPWTNVNHVNGRKWVGAQIRPSYLTPGIQLQGRCHRLGVHLDWKIQQQNSTRLCLKLCVMFYISSK